MRQVKLMKTFIVIFLFLLTVGYHTPGVAIQRVPILLYHFIDEYKGFADKELYVTPDNFTKQMTYLKDHGFTLVTFERWNDLRNIAKPIFITFDDGYKDNLNAYRIFKNLQTVKFKPVGTIFVISDFVTRPNRLSAADIKMLASSGYFSIQSHTATHPNLTKIKDFQKELYESKQKIEKMTGKPVIALAYPYGSFNQKVIDETKKDYRFGLTTLPQAFVPSGKQDDLYVLPRKYINYSTTMEEFKEMVDVK
jgi:peptidoglycan/xylan/chitin deacetylase (PgdA/CDA1 family)